MAQHVLLRFQCSPDISPQTVGSGWYFRAPERTDSSRLNHGPTTICSIFGAPGTNIQTISVLALALESVGGDSSPTLSWPQFGPRESVGEDSSPTLSWPQFFDTWLKASFFGLVRASTKILRPRSHGLNFWPPDSPQDLGRSIGQSASQSLAS